MAAIALARRHPSGFTLIQLGIVLAVAAIAAAAIVPDFIEAQRSRAIEKTAEGAALIHDAARRFYINTSNIAPQLLPQYGCSWPGEKNRGACAPSSPVVLGSAGAGMVQLKTLGYLREFPENPWTGRYDGTTVVYPAGSTDPANCYFVVTTWVPNELRYHFANLLPKGTCNDDSICTGNVTAPAPVTGYTKCCSLVPKPTVTNCP